MPSLFSIFNPTPSFPAYTGPYHVGTLDVEIPTAQIPSPSPMPDPTVSTVSFRIFYPCEKPAETPKPVYWLPEPQREYFQAYLTFLGASPRLAGILHHLPFSSLVSNIKIPAFRDAKIKIPTTSSKRWPVIVFSHGLGGSKNSYSHIAGSLSSHGMVVITPEHRDGSGPISIIRNTDGTVNRAVGYRSIPHKQSEEVEGGRDEQLRIRLWELGVIHEALLKLDIGEPMKNIMAQHDDKPVQGDLPMFASILDVHTPGRISWSGHSFGAATMVQFLKSVFYHSTAPSASAPRLFTPAESSSIVQQITPFSSLSLLDLWTLPILSSRLSWLREKPLPCYSPSGRGGSNLLAVLSEAFFKWRANLEHTKSVVFPPKNPTNKHSSTEFAPPHVFYPVASAHLSQSDFGVLSPWLTKRVFKADDPARTLRLNVRAILEVLRQNGIELAASSSVDMEEETIIEAAGAGKDSTSGPAPKAANGHLPNGQDFRVLGPNGSVRGWISLTATDNDGRKPELGEAANGDLSAKALPSEAVLDSEVLKKESVNGKL